jgi:hypothetical protein
MSARNREQVRTHAQRIRNIADKQSAILQEGFYETLLKIADIADILADECEALDKETT